MFLSLPSIVVHQANYCILVLKIIYFCTLIFVIFYKLNTKPTIDTLA